MRRVLTFLLCVACGGRVASDAVDASVDEALASEAASTDVTSAASDGSLDAFDEPDACAALCNGLCVDTDTDVNNCGACGHVCTATSPLTPGCSAGRCNVVIATNQSSLVIAVDSSYVYWATISEIRRVSKAGGLPTTLASKQPQPHDLTVDNTNVYWTVGFSSTGAVMQARKTGGSAVQLATSYQPAYVAVDDANVYWSNDGAKTTEGSVLSVPIDGGATSTIASSQNGPGYVAVTPTTLYWSVVEDGDIIARTGTSSPTTLASGQTLACALRVDALSAYWATQTQPAKIVTVPLSGGTPTTLASVNDVVGLAIDAQNLYWTEFSAGNVVKMSKAGGTPTVLASHQPATAAIAVDDTFVYWINGVGDIVASDKN